MISKILTSKIAFRSNLELQREKKSNPVFNLDSKYITPENRIDNVAILGCSRTSPQTIPGINRCQMITKALIDKSKRIITGGNDQSGIMAAGFNAAKNSSVKDIETGKPLQNLVIRLKQLYGNENLQDCIVIGTARSEQQRSKLFCNAADHLLFQEGSVTTSLEMANAISLNEYGARKDIILGGRDFYSGIADLYENLFKEGFSKHSAEELFAILDDQKAIVDRISQTQKIQHPSYCLNAMKEVQKEEIAISNTNNETIVSKGGVSTIRKAIALIRGREYSDNPKKIHFVDKDFFKGLEKFYWAMYNAGQLRHKPSQLFDLIDINEAKKIGKII